MNLTSLRSTGGGIEGRVELAAGHGRGRGGPGGGPGRARASSTVSARSGRVRVALAAGPGWNDAEALEVGQAGPALSVTSCGDL